MKEYKMKGEVKMTVEERIEERLHEIYGNDFDSGCYVNGEWLSVNEILNVVFDELD
ncbi:MAG TPA: hypothetical protein PKV66_04975 [Candidatus Pelethenecus sp.]|nr:hypothetical protein [Candidatus Pelethenecus sp.]